MTLMTNTLLSATFPYDFFTYGSVSSATNKYMDVARATESTNLVCSYAHTGSHADNLAASCKMFVRVKPEAPDTTNTNDMSPTDQSALSEMLSHHLIELFQQLKIYKDSTSSDRDTRLHNYLDEKLGEINNRDMIDDVVRSLNRNDHKNQFHSKKNQLITLMAKNTNISNKYNRVWFYHYVSLITACMYAAGITSLYIYGKYYVKKTEDKKTVFYLLLFTSLIVLLLSAVVHAYSIFTKKHYETFTTGSLQDKVMDLVDKLPSHVELYTFLNENLQGELRNRMTIMNSMNKEFDIMNYSSVRKFQSTNYGVNRLYHNMKYIKYGFVVFSIIGLLGGLNIRTYVLLNNTSIINGLPITNGAFWAITSIILVFSMLIVGLQERQNMSRRQYNWNKIYWLIKNNEDNMPKCNN